MRTPGSPGGARLRSTGRLSSTFAGYLMKFLCVNCDVAMSLVETRGPDRGSMTVVFGCPACGQANGHADQFERDAGGAFSWREDWGTTCACRADGRHTDRAGCFVGRGFPILPRAAELQNVRLRGWSTRPSGAATCPGRRARASAWKIFLLPARGMVMQSVGALCRSGGTRRGH